MTGSGLPATESALAAVPAFKKSRLPSLYSDFSHLIDTNLEGYDANIQAWVDVLKQCLVQNVFGSAFTIPGANLAVEFSDSTLGEPKGLGHVLKTQVQQGIFIPWSIYNFTSPNVAMTAREYVSPSKWFEKGFGLMKYWAFSPTNRLGRLTPETYIVWNQLAKVGDVISTKLHHQFSSENVYTETLFDENLFAEAVTSLVPRLSDLEVKILIVYLSRDIGLISVARDHDSATQYIKIGTSPITEQDIAIIKLKKTMSGLLKRKEQLENRLDNDIPRKVKKLFDSKSLNDHLKSVLVQKATLKTSLAKSLTVLNQLSGILEKINEADSNLLLFKTMKDAKDVLSAYNSKLSFEEIDDLQIELDDQVKRTSELSIAMAPAADVNDADVDEELARLEREHEETLKENDAKEQISQLKDANETETQLPPGEAALVEKLNKLSLASKESTLTSKKSALTSKESASSNDLKKEEENSPLPV